MYSYKHSKRLRHSLLGRSWRPAIKVLHSTTHAILQSSHLRVFDSCGGGTQPVTITIGGSETITTSFNLDADVGIDIGGIQIGGGISSSHSDSVTTSQTTQYVVSPGRQVVQVAGIVYKNQTGNIQVNYGDRVFGHYIVSLRLARCRFLSSVIRAEAAVVVYWYTSHRVDSNG